MFKKTKNSASKKLKRATDLISDAVKKSGKAASNTSKAAKQVVSEVATIENVKKVGKTASNVAKTAKKVVVETVTIENIKKIGEITSKATDKENIKKASEAISDFATLKNIKKTGKTISDVASLKSAKGAAKYASGALTGGILLSAHGSKALSRAKKYSAEVDKAVATLEKSWVAMDGIMERVNELKELTLMLEQRAVDEMKKLAPLVPNFDTNNLQHKKVFQKTALLMKSIGEIANTPILDENGSITVDSVVVAEKIKSILNT